MSHDLNDFNDFNDFNASHELINFFPIIPIFHSSFFLLLSSFFFYLQTSPDYEQ